MPNKRISSNDELIDSVGLYIPRPLLLHGYIFPFIFLYSVWAWFWIFVYGISDHFEAGLIIFSGIACVQILTCLFCHWSVHVRCLLTCRKVEAAEQATVAKVVPLPNNGSAEIVSLRRTLDSTGHTSLWFVFQKSKYVWDGGERKQFVALQYPVDLPLHQYMNSKGFTSEDQINEALLQYGKNRSCAHTDDTTHADDTTHTTHADGVQVFCVGLWCLDEYWYYSLFTLFMLIVFECTLVQQQLRNMQEIRKMGNKPSNIQVHRLGKWRSVLSTELLPGDIVSVSRGTGSGASAETIVPCDLLLLRGPAVLDESMLTGESVPQMKESIEGVDLQRPLDLTSDGKLHLLYGGTKLVQHVAPAKTQALLKAPDNGVICYVLRTSFGSSQGRLLRTILYSVSRVTANNFETFVFIMFLLVFAVAAAAYVWVKGCEDPDRNRYKLFLECTLILTSVVPPELPIELSLAVNTSLLSLARLLVYCTEPFRIPFAGKLQVCCFDKTGTLTSDDLVVEGIAGLDGSSDVIAITDAPLHTIQVAAVCHSLVCLEDGVVGDPMEKAALVALDWTLTKGNSVGPRKARSGGLKILTRHHFSSQLKRMSVVASWCPPGAADTCYIAAVKGAPETLRDMVSPEPCPALNPAQVRELGRGRVESGLTFQGFMVISCPLKRDSRDVIRELQDSSHATVMITGDNPLTACHVARQLHITRPDTTQLVLERVDVAAGGEDVWMWRSIDHTVTLPIDIEEKFFRAYDFCVTGEGLTQLRATCPKLWPRLLPHVRVFARVAPKQKEDVITSYKNIGITTLMCGDGTNDVGALKHAHCGVAILSNAPDRPPAKKAKPTEPALPPAMSEKLEAAKKLAKKIDKRGLAPANVPSTRLTPYQLQQQKASEQLQKLLQELDEEQQQMVKLGDASIAAPFTSKLSSIQCVVHIIKQGRCTLVTTLQMFKILALNALILAYSQSVLYLDGIKFSDYQATLQGLLLAACFLFISRSKPLRTLSRERPLANIFNVYTVLTVLLQFCVHFTCLYVLVHSAKAIEPNTKKPDLEQSFEPSLLNSTVYIISMTLQISTFAINYRGRPFMESLRENKALLGSLLGTGGLVMALALGLIPAFAQQFEIVDFPPEFRVLLVQVLLADVSLSFLADRMCLFLFGEGKLRADLRR
ncbi:endoplasmic reticulum transmembrane helix translocase [Hyalella azteca]|uniref:Endoplasmic reticulum transmembrane helix translocase n=1 Tax=Hyalella azteca TaxID=294128 RepID=A0A979FXC7_HYAAZ|nr:endoplasmic reticulum transmembrane helix translocase [Hyalella azteca]